MTVDVRSPTAPGAGRLPINVLSNRWNELRPEGETADREKLPAMKELLGECVAQGSWYDQPEARRKLQALAAEIAEACYWLGGGQYPDAVILPADPRLAPSPSVTTSTTPAPGEVSVSVSNLLLSAFVPPRGNLVGRWEEIYRLDEAWLDPSTHLLVIEASGGTGKSALISEWVARLARSDYVVEGLRMERVFGWSFFSGGPGDHRALGPERFLKQALEFFAGRPPADDPTGIDPAQAGARLARAVRERPSLVVLDGLEPLQHPPQKGRGGPQDHGPARPGALADPALAAFVRDLAAQNSGLCVITTRLAVDDLRSFAEPTVVRIALANLEPSVGADLLRDFQLEGSDADLQEVAASVQGHCLSLTLLGSYLHDVYKRDATRYREVNLIAPPPPRLSDDAGERVQHARRVIAGYDRWFSAGVGEPATPESALLCALALFDHPARMDAILAVLAEPPIPGLTESFASIEALDLLPRTIDRLRKAGLIHIYQREAESGRADEATVLDMHPLVREYFQEKFRREAPAAWREGHLRLFAHDRGNAPEFPATMDAMMTLYRAVVHACEAGRHREALREVLQPRIHQGSKYYSWYRLGAFSTELAVLGHFFRRRWVEVVPEIDDEEDRRYLRYAAVFCLRALGRLEDASKPMRDVFDSLEPHKEKFWKPLGKLAGLLGETSLLQGDFDAAEKNARLAVDFAGRTAEIQDQCDRGALLADVLHQRGHWLDAAREFARSERLLESIAEGRPMLYRLAGYSYCDFLVGQARYLAGARPEPGSIGWDVTEEALGQSLALAGLVRSAGGATAHADPVAAAQQRFRAVIRRMRLIERWLSDETPTTLDLALGQLGRGLAGLALARLAAADAEGLPPRDLLAEAEEPLGKAEALLRRANQQTHLPRGLLGMASLRLLQRRGLEARAYLDEALIISRRGKMKRFLADIHLEYARLHLAADDMANARESLSAAKSLVTSIGYRRRDWEIQGLERSFEPPQPAPAPARSRPAP